VRFQPRVWSRRAEVMSGRSSSRRHPTDKAECSADRLPGRRARRGTQAGVQFPEVREWSDVHPGRPTIFTLPRGLALRHLSKRDRGGAPTPGFIVAAQAECRSGGARTCAPRQLVSSQADILETEVTTATRVVAEVTVRSGARTSRAAARTFRNWIEGHSKAPSIRVL